MNKELATRVDNYLNEHRNELVEDLVALASIPSVSVKGDADKPFGEQCAWVLETALQMAEGYGMQTSNHSNYYGLATHGTGAKTIGIFSHLDVVPEGNGWEYPPYQPTQRDGYLIGRGVCDNKAGAIAGLYTMRCLKELGLPVQSKISLFMGCSEECGMEDISHYVAEQPMPDFSIVPDTAFPICHGEKGILDVDVSCGHKFSQIKSFGGGTVGNVVPDRAEARLGMYGDLIDGLAGLAQSTDGIEVLEDGGDIVVRAHGVSAHASVPAGSVNAIGRLAAFIAEARGIADGDRAIMAMVADTLAESDGSTLGIAFADEPSGALTCISGVATTQEGYIHLNFNIRYPVTDDGMRITTAMSGYFAKHGWQLVDSRDSRPAYLPKEDPKVQMLCKIYSDITGKEATPYVMGGGTYARKLQNAVGFGPENDRPSPLPQGRGGVHQPDEVQHIGDLLEAVKIYVLSLLEVDRILNS